MESEDKSWSILGLDGRQDLLEAIFRVSDLKSLKNFRLVSHLWNKEVLRVLEEKSYISTSKGSLVFLLSTLNTCSAPQCFFTSLEIHFSDTGINSTLREILQNYGHHLKNLRLTGDMKQVYFHLEVDPLHPNNILYIPVSDRVNMQTNIKMNSKLLKKWCPNLKSIRFFTSVHIPDCATTITGVDHCDMKMNESSTSAGTKVNLLNSSVPSSCLRLTTIELDGLMISSLRSYCLQLIQLSPDLRRLIISFGSKVSLGVLNWSAVPTAPLFFQELQKKPQVTKRLQEFRACGLKVPGLTDSIAELEFSPDKLHSLVISGSTNVSDPEFPKFVEFLQKLTKFTHLERLTIVKCSCSSCEWRNWREKAQWRDIEQTIPTLRSVRQLDIASNGTHGIASLSLLNKFPNLYTLDFSRVRMGHPNPDHHRDNIGEFVDFDYFFSDWVYLKLTSEYGDLLRSNCAKIQNLTIHHTISKLASLQCITECFSNLSKLTISIRSGVQYCWEVYMENKLSLSSCLEMLCRLPRLAELYVTMPAGVIYPRQETSRAIKMLRSFPELRHFNLTLGSKEYSKQVPFRCADASHHSVKEMFSDFIVHREAHQFRSCIITFVGVCCCTVTKGELDDIRNLLNSYPHCYRFNWCCHRSARIFARYGNKRYEYSPAPAETKEDAPACRHSKVCESRHWSSDIDIE